MISNVNMHLKISRSMHFNLYLGPRGRKTKGEAMLHMRNIFHFFLQNETKLLICM